MAQMDPLIYGIFGRANKSRSNQTGVLTEFTNLCGIKLSKFGSKLQINNLRRNKFYGIDPTGFHCLVL